MVHLWEGNGSGVLLYPKMLADFEVLRPNTPPSTKSNRTAPIKVWAALSFVSPPQTLPEKAAYPYTDLSLSASPIIPTDTNIRLCCVVLCCVVLCCAVLYCVVLCCAVLYCVVLVLCCVVLCCTVLYCVVLYCVVLNEEYVRSQNCTRRISRYIYHFAKLQVQSNKVYRMMSLSLTMFVLLSLITQNRTPSPSNSHPPS